MKLKERLSFLVDWSKHIVLPGFSGMNLYDVTNFFIEGLEKGAITTRASSIAFNAFRLANFSLKEKDEVRLFLLASGVEYESLHSEKFPINDLAQSFVDNGGQILACGTCLNLRQQDSSELCPLSTMKDLYELIRDCDKTVTF